MELREIETESESGGVPFFALLVGAAIGAGIMYFMHPARGADYNQRAVGRAQRALQDAARRSGGFTTTSDAKSETVEAGA